MSIASPLAPDAIESTESPETQLHVDTDSGKSSCSPALLDCSFDSGIAVLDVNDLQLHKRIQLCRRILHALERDEDAYQRLRERLSKIVDKRSLKENDAEGICNVCCGALEPKDVKSFVTCFVCKKSVCRGATCADWQPKTASWVCQLCGSSKQSLANTSSWVAEQMSFNQQKLVYPLRARSEIYIPISDCNEGSMHFESVSQVGVNAETVTAAQKLKIREYVEEVVANMLGSLDKVTVEQLSKSETYMQLFTKYHAKLSNIFIGMENTLCCKALNGGDLPAIANGHSNHHVSASSTNLAQSPASGNNNSTMDFVNVSEARLRQLIESIIAETLRLPNALATATGCGAVSEIALNTRGKDADIMTNGAAGGRRHRTEHYFEPQIYQDLLATAVLNKIVDKQSKGRLLAESTPDLSGQNVDSNFNVENQSTTSDSSLEPRSDCSYSTDTELNVEKADEHSTALLSAGRESVISDYIASHMVPLPDLSTPATESEDDDYASVNSSAVGEGTWEDNWLFKKKRTSTSSACGIGMLVPAPKEDVRAQIGDKTADEVSDLSEMGSDTDDSSLDLLRANINPLNDRLLSKQLIGGQNTKIVLDELIETASLISNTAPAENEPIFIETKNVPLIDTATKTKAINLDIDQSQNQANREGAAAEVESNEANNSADLPTSHPLSAPKLVEDLLETPSCTGFSTVELFDSNPTDTGLLSIDDKYSARSPSVIEILAAIALGPMLAVPTSDQQAVLTPIELTSLKELSDLALAEINARTPEIGNKTLGVIHEEISEEELSHDHIAGIDESILALHQDPQRTNELLAKAVELLNTPQTKTASTSTNDVQSEVLPTIEDKSEIEVPHALSQMTSIITQEIQREIGTKSENISVSTEEKLKVQLETTFETQESSSTTAHIKLPIGFPKENETTTQENSVAMGPAMITLVDAAEEFPRISRKKLCVINPTENTESEGEIETQDNSALQKTSALEVVNQSEEIAVIQQTKETIEISATAGNVTEAVLPSNKNPNVTVKLVTQENSIVTQSFTEALTVQLEVDNDIKGAKLMRDSPVPTDIAEENTVTVDETVVHNTSAVKEISKTAPGGHPIEVSVIKDATEHIDIPTSLEGKTKEDVVQAEENIDTVSEIVRQDTSAETEISTKRPVVQPEEVHDTQEADESINKSAATDISTKEPVVQPEEKTFDTVIQDPTARTEQYKEARVVQPEKVTEIKQEEQTINIPTKIKTAPEEPVQLENITDTESDTVTQDSSAVRETSSQALALKPEEVSDIKQTEQTVHIPLTIESATEEAVVEPQKNTDTAIQDSSAVTEIATVELTAQTEEISNVKEADQIIYIPLTIESAIDEAAAEPEENTDADSDTIQENSAVTEISTVRLAVRIEEGFDIKEAEHSIDKPPKIENATKVAVVQQENITDRATVTVITALVVQPKTGSDIKETKQPIDIPDTIESATEEGVGEADTNIDTASDTVIQESSAVTDFSNEALAVQPEEGSDIKEAEQTIDMPDTTEGKTEVSIEQPKTSIDPACDKGIQESSAVKETSTEALSVQPEKIPNIKEADQIIYISNSIENATKESIEQPERSTDTASRIVIQDSSARIKISSEALAVKPEEASDIKEAEPTIYIPETFKSATEDGVGEADTNIDLASDSVIQESSAVTEISTEALAVQPEEASDIKEAEQTIDIPDTIESAAEESIEQPETNIDLASVTVIQESSAVTEISTEALAVQPEEGPDIKEAEQTIDIPDTIESGTEGVGETDTNIDTANDTLIQESSAVTEISNEVLAVQPEEGSDIKEADQIIYISNSIKTAIEESIEQPETNIDTSGDTVMQESSAVTKIPTEALAVQPEKDSDIKEAEQTIDLPNSIESAIEESIEQPETNIDTRTAGDTVIQESSAVTEISTEALAVQPEETSDIKEAEQTIDIPDTIESATEKSIEQPETNIDTISDTVIQESSAVTEISTEALDVQPEEGPDIKEAEQTIDTPDTIKSGTEGVGETDTNIDSANDTLIQESSAVTEISNEALAVQSEEGSDTKEADQIIYISNSIKTAMEESIEQPETNIDTSGDTVMQESSAVTKISTEALAVQPEEGSDIKQAEQTIHIPDTIESATEECVEKTDTNIDKAGNTVMQESTAVTEISTEALAIQPEEGSDIKEAEQTIHIPDTIESATEEGVEKTDTNIETAGDTVMQESTAVTEISTEALAVQPEEASDIKEAEQTIDLPDTFDSATEEGVGEADTNIDTADSTVMQESTAVTKISTEALAVQTEDGSDIKEAEQTIYIPDTIESATEEGVEKIDTNIDKACNTVMQESTAVTEISTEALAVQPEEGSDIKEEEQAIDILNTIESAKEGVEKADTNIDFARHTVKQESSAVTKISTEALAVQPEEGTDIKKAEQTIHIPDTIESATEEGVEKTDTNIETAGDTVMQESTAVTEISTEALAVQPEEASDIKEAEQTIDLPDTFDSATEEGVGEADTNIDTADSTVMQESTAVTEISTEALAVQKEDGSDIKEAEQTIYIPDTIESATEEGVEKIDTNIDKACNTVMQESTAVTEISTEALAVQPEEGSDIKEEEQAIDILNTIESAKEGVEQADTNIDFARHTVKQESSAVTEISTEALAVQPEEGSDIKEAEQTIHIPDTIESATEEGVEKTDTNIETAGDTVMQESTAVTEISTEAPAVQPEDASDIKEAEQTKDLPDTFDSATEEGVGEADTNIDTADDTVMQESTAVTEISTEALAVQQEEGSDIKEAEQTIYIPDTIESATEEGVEKIDTNIDKACNTVMQESTAVTEISTEALAVQPEEGSDIKEEEQAIDILNTIESAKEGVEKADTNIDFASDTVKQESSAVTEISTEVLAVQTEEGSDIKEAEQTIDLPNSIESAIEDGVEKTDTNIDTSGDTVKQESSAVKEISTEALAVQPEEASDIKEAEKTIYIPDTIENATEEGVGVADVNIDTSGDTVIQESSAVTEISTEALAVQPEETSDIKEAEQTIDIPDTIESATEKSIEQPETNIDTISDTVIQESSAVTEISTEALSVQPEEASDIKEAEKTIYITDTIENAAEEAVGVVDTNIVTASDTVIQESSAVKEISTEALAVQPEEASDIKEAENTIYIPDTIESAAEEAVGVADTNIVTASDTVIQESSAVKEISTEALAVQPEEASDIKEAEKTIYITDTIENATEEGVEKTDTNIDTSGDTVIEESSSVTEISTEALAVQPEKVSDIKEAEPTIYIPETIKSATEEDVTETDTNIVTASDTVIQESSAVKEISTEALAVQPEEASDIKEAEKTIYITDTIENATEEGVEKTDTNIDTSGDTVIEESSSVTEISTEALAVQPEKVSDIKEAEPTIYIPETIKSATEEDVTETDTNIDTASDTVIQESSAVKDISTEALAVQAEEGSDIKEAEKSIDIPDTIESATEEGVGEADTNIDTASDTVIQESSAVTEISTEALAVQPEEYSIIKEAEQTIDIPDTIKSATEEGVGEADTNIDTASDIVIPESSAVTEISTEALAVQPEEGSDIKEAEQTIDISNTIESATVEGVGEADTNIDTASDTVIEESSSVTEISTEALAVQPEECSIIKEGEQTIDIPDTIESATEEGVGEADTNINTASDIVIEESSAVTEISTEALAVQPEEVSDIKEAEQTINIPDTIESSTEEGVEKTDTNIDTASDTVIQESSAVTEISTEASAVQPEEGSDIKEAEQTIDIPDTIESAAEEGIGVADTNINTASDTIIEESSAVTEISTEALAVQPEECSIIKEGEQTIDIPDKIEIATEEGVGEADTNINTASDIVIEESSAVTEISTEALAVKPEEVSDIKEAEQTINIPDTIESATEEGVGEADTNIDTASDTVIQESSSVTEILTEALAVQPEEGSDIKEAEQTIDIPDTIESATEEGVEKTDTSIDLASDTVIQESSAVTEISTEALPIQPEEGSDIKEAEQIIDIPDTIESAAEEGIGVADTNINTASDTVIEESSAVTEISTEALAFQPEECSDVKEAEQTIDIPDTIESAREEGVGEADTNIDTASDTVIQESSSVTEISTEALAVQPEEGSDIKEAEQTIDISDTIERATEEGVGEADTNIDTASDTVIQESSAVTDISTDAVAVQPEEVSDFKEAEQTIDIPDTIESVTEEGVEKTDTSIDLASDTVIQESSAVTEISTEASAVQPEEGSDIKEAEQTIDIPDTIESAAEEGVGVADTNIDTASDTVIQESSAVTEISTEALAVQPEEGSDIKEAEQTIDIPATIESATEEGVGEADKNINTASDTVIQESSAVTEISTEALAVQPEECSDIKEAEQTIDIPDTIESATEEGVGEADTHIDTDSDTVIQESSAVTEISTEALAVQPDEYSIIKEAEQTIDIPDTIESATEEGVGEADTNINTASDIVIEESSAVTEISTEALAVQPEESSDIKEAKQTIDIPDIIKSATEEGVGVADTNIDTASDTVIQESSAVTEISTEALAVQPEECSDIKEAEQTIDITDTIESAAEEGVGEADTNIDTDSDIVIQESSAVTEISTEALAVQPDEYSIIKEAEQTIDIPDIIESATEEGVGEADTNINTASDIVIEESSAVTEISTEALAVQPEESSDIKEAEQIIDIPATIESATEEGVGEADKNINTASDTVIQESSAVTEISTEALAVQPEECSDIKEAEQTIDIPDTIESATEEGVGEADTHIDTDSGTVIQESSAVTEISTEALAVQPEECSDIKEAEQTIDIPDTIESATEEGVGEADTNINTASDIVIEESSAVTEISTEALAVQPEESSDIKEAKQTIDIPDIIKSATEEGVGVADTNIDTASDTVIPESTAVTEISTEALAVQPEECSDIKEAEQTIDIPDTIESAAEEGVGEADTNIDTDSDIVIQESSTVTEISAEALAVQPEEGSDINEAEQTIDIPDTIERATEEGVGEADTNIDTASDTVIQESSAVTEISTEALAVQPEEGSDIKEAEQTIDIADTIESATKEVVEEADTNIDTASDTVIEESSAVTEISTEALAIQSEEAYNIDTIESATEESIEQPGKSAATGNYAVIQDSSEVMEISIDALAVKPEEDSEFKDAEQTISLPAAIESDTEEAVAIPETNIDTANDAVIQESFAVTEILTEVLAVQPEDVSKIKESEQTIDINYIIKHANEKAVVEPEKNTNTANYTLIQDSSAGAKISNEALAFHPKEVFDIKQADQTTDITHTIESVTNECVEKSETNIDTASDIAIQDSSAVTKFSNEALTVMSENSSNTNQPEQTIDISATIESATEESIEQQEKSADTGNYTVIQENSAVTEISAEALAVQPEEISELKDEEQIIDTPATIESATEEAAVNSETNTNTARDIVIKDNSAVTEISTEALNVPSEKGSNTNQPEKTIDIPATIESATKEAVVKSEKNTNTESNTVIQESSAVTEISAEALSVQPELVYVIKQAEEFIDMPSTIESATKEAIEQPKKNTDTASDTVAQDSSVVTEIPTEALALQPKEVSDIKQADQTTDITPTMKSVTKECVEKSETNIDTASDIAIQNSSAVTKISNEALTVMSEKSSNTNQPEQTIDISATIESATEESIEQKEKSVDTGNYTVIQENSAVTEISAEALAVQPEEISELKDEEQIIDTHATIENANKDIDTANDAVIPESSTVTEISTEALAVQPEEGSDIKEAEQTIDMPDTIKNATEETVNQTENNSTSTSESQAICVAAETSMKPPAVQINVVPDAQEGKVAIEFLASAEIATEEPVVKPEECIDTAVESQNNSEMTEFSAQVSVAHLEVKPVVQEVVATSDIQFVVEAASNLQTIDASNESTAIRTELLTEIHYEIVEPNHLANSAFTDGSSPTQTQANNQEDFARKHEETMADDIIPSATESITEAQDVQQKQFSPSKMTNETIEPVAMCTKNLPETVAKTECIIATMNLAASQTLQEHGVLVDKHVIPFDNTEQDSPNPEIFNDSKINQQTFTDNVGQPVIPEDVNRESNAIPSQTVKELNDPNISSSAAILQDEGERKSVAPVGDSTQKRLRRQHNVIDTTSSIDKTQSQTVTDLATLCQFYIKDKRLLAALENRRRQTLVMHRYLSSFDSFETPVDNLLPETTTIVSTSADDAFYVDATSVSDSLLVEDRCQHNFDFINEILFSDQLSSNHTDDSPPSYIETYSMQTDCDETVGNTTTVLCNGTTTILTNPTTTTTNNTNHTLTNESPRSAVNGDDPEHLSNGLNNGVVYHDDDDDDDSALFRRFVPGSIAEREYMKWNNAVEMPNNPYAPEALKRRISGSQERFIDLPNISPSKEQNPLTLLQSEKDETDTVERTREDYKRYSRDYYINESKAQASCPKRHTTSEFNISDDPSTDHITINEADKEKSAEPAIYQARPAHVVEENASIETLSNLSLQSVNTTTSDDSDTVRIYDFRKQETTIIRPQNAMRQGTTETTASMSVDSVDEPALDETQQPSERRERPKELHLAASTSASASASRVCTPTPSRGSTPVAFKFMQPKRKLIDPSQVLSFDEAEPQPPTPPGEKTVIEEDLMQVLPSVKALALAFLQSAHTPSPVERRWKRTVKQAKAITDPSASPPPTTPTVQRRHLEASPSIAEIAEDATIASDLSSLETDPPTHKEEDSSSQSVSPRRSAGGRYSFLRSNIAFFENLKFK